MRNPQFCVSAKRPVGSCKKLRDIATALIMTTLQWLMSHSVMLTSVIQIALIWSCIRSRIPVLDLGRTGVVPEKMVFIKSVNILWIFRYIFKVKVKPMRIPGHDNLHFCSYSRRVFPTDWYYSILFLIQVLLLSNVYFYSKVPLLCSKQL